MEDDRSAARHLLWVPRVILFVPKWGLWLAMSPVRGGLYVLQRYGLDERLRRLFSGNGPIAVFPSVARESGHGLTYGVGAGIGRYVRGNFLFGGEVRQVYELRLRTRQLLGDSLELELGGQLQLLDESLFFGIGNRDLEDAGTQSGIDAQTDPTAVAARYDQENFFAELAAEWRPLEVLTGRATLAYLDKDYRGLGADAGNLVDIADVYDTDTLVGFENGTRYGYAELRLSYDDRVTTNPFVSLAQPSSGWKLEGFAGRTRGLIDTDPSSYFRYGLDVQRYVDLYMGDRILVLRAYLEGVTAGIDEIPFTELPRIGGSRLMRGYARNRFRDRTATAFSVEYKFPINRTMSAFAFLDGGGAWRELTDFDPAELHPGYGAGVQLHTANLFLTRFLVASGDDGLTFYLSFTPSSELRLTTHAW
jgi:Omp85 superfamily domain